MNQFIDAFRNKSLCFILTAVLILLSACSAPATSGLNSGESPKAESNAPTNGQSLSGAAATPSPTNTQSTPTATNIPPTPTITLTPTPQFPVAQGTSIPESEKITASNFRDLTELARWGNGAPTDGVFTPDGSKIIISTFSGLYVFDAHSLEMIHRQ